MNETTGLVADLTPQQRALLELRLRRRRGEPAREQIPRRSRAGQPLPLSYEQQRLWFLDRLEPDIAAYNIPAAVRLTGRLDVPALERTLGEIVRRHEILRTRFADERGLPVQIVDEPSPLRLDLFDLSDHSEDERHARLKRLVAAEARKPFDLTMAPLLRATLVRLSDEEHAALLTMHHIVSDGWSMGVLVREVAALYGAFREGRASPLPELPIQYADYAAWQRERLSGEALEGQLAYWRKQLAGARFNLDLPSDRPRPARQTFRGDLHPFSFPAELADNLRDLSRREGATLFMTLLAGWSALLARYTGETDLVIGTDVANRQRAETEGLVGFFVNQLALRTDVGGDPSFRELVGRAKEACLGAYAHQEVPFDRVVEAVRPERDAARTPLFQTKLALQTALVSTHALPGLAVSPLEPAGGAARTDLTLLLNEEPDGRLSGLVEYSTDLFDAWRIRRTVGHYQTLLAAAAEDADARHGALLARLEDGDMKRTAEEAKPPARASFERFRNVRARAVELSSLDLVKVGSLGEGQPLPCLVEPAREDVDLTDWARGHLDFIESHLRRGAILFRGFGIDSVETFGAFVGSVCSELFNENGEHPRESLSRDVYTPVFYPPEQMLLWHNENSFNHRWPMKIWFCCVEPAERGGETPVVDSRRVFEEIEPEVRERFLERGVMYVRNYGEGLGLDWQTVFRTDDPAEAERRCRENRMSFEWTGGGRLHTRAVRPAAVRHPKTGEWAWFTQLLHWHPSCLDPRTRASLRSLFAEDELPRNCFYGDGTSIEDEVMAAILDVYRRLEVRFPWRRGDVLMVDNLLAAHGRYPFEGRRKLLVALGEMRSFDEV